MASRRTARRPLASHDLMGNEIPRSGPREWARPSSRIRPSRMVLFPCRVGKNARVAFGQQSGPPASATQIRELLALLKEAGHVDFRDARGPMGFTQRQAGGKFTRDEAATIIAQLMDAEAGESVPVASAWRQSAQEQVMKALPSEQLADELRRRGWRVIEP